MEKSLEKMILLTPEFRFLKARTVLLNSFGGNPVDHNHVLSIFISAFPRSSFFLNSINFARGSCCVSMKMMTFYTFRYEFNFLSNYIVIKTKLHFVS